MSVTALDDDFEYDKPGTERSRRRRAKDDDLNSDLEENLLEEEWPAGKKNPSEASDEELNDDLLQSDDEFDQEMSGQSLSLNATFSLGASYEQQDNVEEAEITDDVGTESYEQGDVGYEDEEEEYTEEYCQGDNTEMPEHQMDYAEELAEGHEGYQDEVLDIQINEPLDGEFQDDEYSTNLVDEIGNEHGDEQEEALDEEEEAEEEEEQVQGDEQQQRWQEQDCTGDSQASDKDEVENHAVQEEELKEESDEEDDDEEGSRRLRFKSERKDGAVVRLSDAGSKRRNIPETLELSEQAKADLMEFEEQERQKRQNRYGGRGRGGGGGGGRSRGRGFLAFGMGDFRGAGNRARLNDHRHPMMPNIGMQPSSRMPPPHQSHQPLLQSQPQHHHSVRPRGPPPFQEHGSPLGQQPLQPLIPPHMAHRSPPLRPQMEPPPRMMSSPPPNFPPHHQQQPPQPKNIHINPHFRGPASSPVQVPLMPPAQSQARPAAGPQRFPGPVEFQQHMPGNFAQPQRPPHHMEPFRNQPPQGPQDREPLFMGEHGESARFPGQHMFDHPGPNPLMNNSNNLHHQQQMPSQGHMGFGPPGPPFNQPGQGPLGLFPREPPRQNLPPHPSHQGMVGLNQQGGPLSQPRPFMGPRQPFGQEQVFPAQVQFGMQGLMHGPPLSQVPRHEPLPSHQPMHQHQQHHRQDMPPHQQHHLNLNEPHPMMHHGQNPFHQQTHGSPRQMTPHPQNPLLRNAANRQRMSSPACKQIPPLRNSNLRELPVAPGNANIHAPRPTPTPASYIRPVAKATQGVRPGQNSQPLPDAGRGRGQVVAKAPLHPTGPGRTVVRKEIPPSSAAPEDPDEDEETRQYRQKIEEQKRLREEILKRKEMRRQMQAGVRKKELLDRLNAQTNAQNPGPAPPLASAPPQLQLTPQPAAQPQQDHNQPPQFQQQPQLGPGAHQTPKTPGQAAPVPPNGTEQPAVPRPNVKSRLQMGRGSGQPPLLAGPGPNQLLLQQQQEPPQQHIPLQLQQRSGVALHNQNRPGPQNPALLIPQRNIPTVCSFMAQPQTLKPGVKRTVMQRARNSGGPCHQTPQKVRVVKLSGTGGMGPEPGCEPTHHRDDWPAHQLNQGAQRKVTMPNAAGGQQPQTLGAAPQGGRGAAGGAQQNRVVVPARGRGRGAAGPGAGQMGRGRPMAARPNPGGAERERCTVSIEGLSSSTTDAQLQNLLKSIGPIEMFKMIPQQRKAIAKFSNPQHAASFQMSFNRHMIDLSHIDVSLIDG